MMLVRRQEKKMEKITWVNITIPDIERYKDTDRYEYFKRQIKREGMGLKGQNL